MAKFTCKCGDQLKLKTGLESYEKKMISNKKLDLAIDEVFAKIDTITSNTNWISNQDARIDFAWSTLRKEMLQVLDCPQCGRLWVQEKIGSEKMRSYVLEA